MGAYSLGVYEGALPGNLDWREKLMAAGEIGFDFLEINIDGTPSGMKRLDMSPEQKSDLQQCIKDTGVPLKAMHLDVFRRYPLGSRNDGICAKGLQLLEKGVKLASELGIPVIRLSGYDVYYEIPTDETAIRFEKSMKQAALIAAKYGVMLGLEILETEPMDTVGKVSRLIEKIRSAYLGVYLNSGNITVSAGMYNLNVWKDIQEGKGHILASHLKDSIPGPYQDIPFGAGSVDFNSFVKQAWKEGVRSFVMEMKCGRNEEWKSALSRGYLEIAGYLDKVNS